MRRARESTSLKGLRIGSLKANRCVIATSGSREHGPTREAAIDHSPTTGKLLTDPDSGKRKPAWPSSIISTEMASAGTMSDVRTRNPSSVRIPTNSSDTWRLALALLSIRNLSHSSHTRKKELLTPSVAKFLRGLEPCHAEDVRNGFLHHHQHSHNSCVT